MPGFVTFRRVTGLGGDPVPLVPRLLGKSAGTHGDTSLCPGFCDERMTSMMSLSLFCWEPVVVHTGECFHSPFLLVILSSQKIVMIKPTNAQ